MSRRHHGNRPPRLGPPRGHLEAPAEARAPSGERRSPGRHDPPAGIEDRRTADERPVDLGDLRDAHGRSERARNGDHQDGPAAVGAPELAASAGVVQTADKGGAPVLDGSAGAHHVVGLNGTPAYRDGPAVPSSAGCTAPQLRRFIKSRPYVPMHELRRRFGINGTEDEVSPIDLADRRVFVGLPPREGSLLGELLRGGDIGYELSLDPRTPVVVGLYPMRPIARS